MQPTSDSLHVHQGNIMKNENTETTPNGKLSDASSCSQSRFDNWTREDYEREKKRISRQLRHFEAVIPKLKRAQRFQEMKAFDPAI